uniref:Cystine/glutamate transporter (Trinotate prediction) n=1 Tax=Myxobolus squamalis TaxID=59785 RepID=A0A6B2G0T7_MYXSQ
MSGKIEMDSKKSRISSQDCDSSKSQSCSNVEVFIPTKNISFIYALSMTIGSIIGSGIFVTAKDSFNVSDSESIGMVTLLWVSGALASMILGLSYAELGTRISQSGGERAYYKEILDDKFARTFVIFFVFIIKTLTMAALSVSAGRYLIVMVDMNQKKRKFGENSCNCIASSLLGCELIQ